MKKKINLEFLKIIAGGLLFFLALIFIKIKIISIILLSVSYILMAYKVYIYAMKNILKGEVFDENLLMIIATLGAFYINEPFEGVVIMLLFQLEIESLE